MRTHFKVLIGDVNWQQYGGKFISKRMNNGEFDYWIVMEVINLHESIGDESAEKYNVSLQAVSPQQAGQDKLDQAFGSCGFSDSDLAQIENNPLYQVEALSDYGIYAPLWNQSGNNLKLLLREAHRQADLSSMLFGFYMDKHGNRLGQTGWDLISGQDVREFFASR